MAYAGIYGEQYCETDEINVHKSTNAYVRLKYKHKTTYIQDHDEFSVNSHKLSCTTTSAISLGELNWRVNIFKRLFIDAVKVSKLIDAVTPFSRFKSLLLSSKLMPVSFCINLIPCIFPSVSFKER